MIELRTVDADADLLAWTQVKSRVVSNEPVTVQQMRANPEPDRLLVLAELDGVLAGCGIADRSSFDGRAFIAARVLAEHRGHGVGVALVRALSDHARALGLGSMNASVYADEPHSVKFAEKLGLTEVDYELEQIRALGAGLEPEPEPVDGFEVHSLAGRREELLELSWPLALAGYADMPLPGEVSYRQETWLREEATRPEGSFVALSAGEPVGFAGLREHANGPATAEHGLTVVDPAHRGRGLARLLKRSQIAWAARTGVVELVTWTQQGNEAMAALNRSLGYVDKSKVIVFQGPLPG
jgi:mycothiol synthase